VDKKMTNAKCQNPNKSKNAQYLNDRMCLLISHLRFNDLFVIWVLGFGFLKYGEKSR
jgi:hypothetical protein